MLIEHFGSDVNNNIAGKSISAPQGIHNWRNFFMKKTDSSHDWLITVSDIYQKATDLRRERLAKFKGQWQL